MRTPRHIEFDPVVEGCFDAWARYLGQNPKRFRRATLNALSTRLHEAELAELLRPHPPKFRLKLAPTAVIFTIEPHAIVVRGYDELEGVDPDCGWGMWCVCDYDWLHDDAKPEGRAA